MIERKSSTDICIKLGDVALIQSLVTGRGEETASFCLYIIAIARVTN